MNQTLFKVFYVLTALSAGLQTAEAEEPLKHTPSAVFEISHPYAKGLGFFVEDQKTFATTFQLLYRLAKELPQENSWVNLLEIKKGGKTFKVKSLKNLSPFSNLALLEVEGYNGSFLQLSGTPFYINRQTYAVIALDHTEKITPLRAEGVFEKSETQFSFSGLLSQKPDKEGGPVVNSKGQVIGVVEKSDSNIFTAVKESFLENLFIHPPSPYKNTSESNVLEHKLIHLTKLAEHGNTLAQLRLGLILSEAEAAQKNAAQWLTRAALQENPSAQFHLGMMFYNGKGVPKNLEQAFAFLENAARNEHTFSQFQAGLMLLYGNGIPQNKNLARKWLTEAAKQGHFTSQLYLSFLLASWFQNEREAEFWRDKVSQTLEINLLKE